MQADHEAMRGALTAWFAANGRHALPWRQTRDPYAVLVSEVMLQQTQVERVRPYYDRWLARWPRIADLAGAPVADVIREWSGLGYNRRAVYLHRTGTTAVERHGGALPTAIDELRQLPGIGPYTASAVACFAAGARVPVLDTNIARVVARVLLGVASQREATANTIERAATAFLPGDGARDHNLALMDLGAMVCTSRAPDCGACPLARGCAWRLRGAPAGTTRGRTAPKFEETARFARGRIVEALREHASLQADAIAARLPGPHAAEVARYLFALEADGLVEQTGELWQLAGQGKSSIASPKL